MTQYQIPFDETGSLMHYPKAWNVKIWKENYTFEGALHFFEFKRGRSAAYAVFVDDGGHQYPMFLSKLEEVLSGQGIHGGSTFGKWTFYKRGTNYSIGLVRE